MSDTENVERGPVGYQPQWTWDAEPVDGYLEMIDALRGLQDRIAGSAPPAAVVATMRRMIAETQELLEPYEVGEADQVFARVSGVAGRAQTMSPRFVLTAIGDGRVEGTTMFGRYYLGGNGAVHGGAIPLLFDEVLGRLANSDGRAQSRTAYLRVDYRSITPIEVQLAIRGEFVSEQGRKRLLRATIHDGETLCAEGEGLFLELRDGQP